MNIGHIQLHRRPFHYTSTHSWIQNATLVHFTTSNSRDFGYRHCENQAIALSTDHCDSLSQRLSATGFTSPANRLARSYTHHGHTVCCRWLYSIEIRPVTTRTTQPAYLLTAWHVIALGYLLPTSNFTSHNSVCLSERFSSNSIHQQLGYQGRTYYGRTLCCRWLYSIDISPVATRTTQPAYLLTAWHVIALGYLLPTSNFTSHNFVCLYERLSSYSIHQSSHSVSKVELTTVALSAAVDCTPSR